MQQKVTGLLIVFVFFVKHGTCQTNYFFKPSVLEEGNGTQLHPFKSLQKLSAIALQPGDTVFFWGDKIAANIALENIHGRNDQHVVFTSYGKKRCVIDGKDKAAFIVTASSYFTFHNLTFTGDGRKTGNTTDGVKIMNCKNLSLHHLVIKGFQKSGLLLFNCDQVEVDSVHAVDNGFAGILADGDLHKGTSANIHMTNCVADNNAGDPTVLNNHSGNGILIGNSKNVLIEYCSATNNGWDMPRIGNGPVGIWAFETDSIIIQYCIAYKNKTAVNAVDGGGFDLDGGVTNGIVQYCLSYENWGSGYGIFQYDGASKWNNNIVRYCISINDGQVTDQACAMLVWNGGAGDKAFTNFKAYNNFFYNDKKYAFGFASESQHRNFSFYNNIFIAADTAEIFNGIDSSDSDIYLGNVWMNKQGGFRQDGFTIYKQWAKATSQEMQNGSLTGTTFNKELFSIPSRINITDPHKLQTDKFLLSLCSSDFRSTGINIKEITGIDPPEKDFFGHPAASVDFSGICTIKLIK